MRKTWDQFNGPCLKCNCLATLVRRTFPAIWMKIEKYVLVFTCQFLNDYVFPKKILLHKCSSDLNQTGSRV